MTQPFRLDAKGLEVLKATDGLPAEVIRGNAADVDQNARFPRENVDALRSRCGQGEGRPPFASSPDDEAAVRRVWADLLRTSPMVHTFRFEPELDPA
jgi:hypothetical protein